jgi:excisionase family DNA binding protein
MFKIVGMKQKTMTTREVCDALGISLSTLRRRIKSGELKPIPKAPGQKRAYRLNFFYADIEVLLRTSKAEENTLGRRTS